MDKETLYEMAQQMMTIAQQILTLLGEKRQASFELWSLQWYSTYKKPYVSEKQSEIIQICLRKHIPQWFKDKDLMDITTFDIETALAEVKSSKMRQLTYDTIAGVLASAYENELILKNPAIKIKRPKHNEVVGQPLCLPTRRLDLTFTTVLCFAPVVAVERRFPYVGQTLTTSTNIFIYVELKHVVVIELCHFLMIYFPSWKASPTT